MHKSANAKATYTRHEPGAIRGFALGILLGASLVYGALMAASATMAQVGEEAQALNESLLPALVAARQPGDVSVVVLGNSRVRYGFLHGFDPAAPVTLPDGRTARVVQFGEDVAQFQQYETLWPSILAAKPDLIVFTDMLISTQRRAAKMSAQNFSDVLFQGIRRKLDGKTPAQEWEEARRDIKDACLPEFKSPQVQDRLIFTAHRDNHSLTDNPNTEAARRAIRQAVQMGIPVAVLRFPSHEPAYSAYDVPRHLIDFYGLGYVPTPEQLLPDDHAKVQWMEYPRPPAAHYCDFVHFNANGRGPFTDWLLGQIATRVPR